jgi:hypothetical protein
LDANFLLPFANLTELRLDYLTSLVFRSAVPFFSAQTMAILGQVTKLEITFDFNSRFNMAPLPGMTNLKWLYLRLGLKKPSPAEEVLAFEALRSLKTLVNLEGLELKGLPGVPLADKCAQEVFPEWACENLRWLTFRDIQEEPHQTSTFTQIMDKFPKLEQLSFKISKPGKDHSCQILVCIFC